MAKRWVGFKEESVHFRYLEPQCGNIFLSETQTVCVLAAKMMIRWLYSAFLTFTATLAGLAVSRKENTLPIDFYFLVCELIENIIFFFTIASIFAWSCPIVKKERNSSWSANSLAPILHTPFFVPLLVARWYNMLVWHLRSRLYTKYTVISLISTKQGTLPQNKSILYENQTRYSVGNE